MQSTRNTETRLCRLLQNSAGLKTLGCRFARGLTGGICVTIDGEASGAWWYDKGAYHFSFMAHRLPEYSVATANDVLGKTSEIATVRLALKKGYADAD